MQYQIREATIGDYDGLCRILAEGDRFHQKALPKVYRQPEGYVRTKEFIVERLHRENSIWFVAEHEGQIVGSVDVSIRQAEDSPLLVPRRYAKVGTLLVAERHRRRGIATALLGAAHRWALDQGVDQVELNAYEFNQGAIALYEKLGYKTARRTMWKDL